MKTILAIALMGASFSIAGCQHYDPGGSVHEYLARKHEPRLIDYPCYSACTVYLQSPKTCYTPEATFHFHGVTVAATGEYDAGASGLFAARFWPEMRAHLLEVDALRSPDHWHVMTGAQVAALDTVERECQ
jgi:hypothetical protein